MSVRVLWVSHGLEESGWGFQARNHILAADAAGIDIVPRFIKLNSSTPKVSGRLNELAAKSDKSCDICIQNVLPHYLDYNGDFSKNIAYCMYESLGGETNHWQSHINTMDELWTSSSFSAECFRSMGVKIPIKIVPLAFDLAKYEKEYKKLDHPELNGDFVFYTIADFNKRKDLSSLVRAFYLAFTPNEPVKLLIKTSKFNTSGRECAQIIFNDCNKIRESMKLYRRIEDYIPEVIIGDTISDDDIMSVHTTGDVFVTCSHGEAWSIPLWEAGAMGKECIFTGLTETGPMFDFAFGASVKTTKSYVFGMTDTFFELGSSRERWYDVDVLDLARAMRVAYSNRDQNDDVATKFRKDQAKRYSLQTVGSIMKDLLNA